MDFHFSDGHHHHLHSTTPPPILLTSFILIQWSESSAMAPVSPSLPQFSSPELKGTHPQPPTLTDASAMYDVRGGTRAVIFDRLSGVKRDVVEEGTHFLIPWLQKAVIFDVRTRPRNISTTTGSKDLQMVSLTLRVLHRPNVVELPRIYQVCIRILWQTLSLLRVCADCSLWDWIMMRGFCRLLEMKC